MNNAETAMILLLWLLSVIVAFFVGTLVEVRGARAHWRTFRYCPTCDRLDCTREHAWRIPPAKSAQ